MTDAPPVIDTAFLAAASAAELEDWGPREEATSAGVPMSVRGLTVWTAPDESGAEAGIWECTAGPSYWVQEENEVIYLLSGTLTVTPDGREAADARARRRRRLPARLARPVGAARDRAQGLRHLLTHLGAPHGGSR